MSCNFPLPDPDLKNLAQEVTDLLKKQIGVPAFTTAFANCQKRKLEKRELKKRHMAAEVGFILLTKNIFIYLKSTSQHQSTKCTVN